jgi:hypothetical protein
LAIPSTGQLASQENLPQDIRVLSSFTFYYRPILIKDKYRFVDHDTPSEKHSTLNLSRLYGGGNRKPPGRPSTSDGGTPSPSFTELRGPEDKKEKEKQPKYKDEMEFGSTANLRKPEFPNDDIPPRGMQTLKPGQSVIDQIGEPDHRGWMRKKGDRYNSWKSRYFVLKGPHLYILKSQDKLVSGIDYL